MSDWMSKKNKGVIELRKTYSSTGNRFSQVLVKISLDGVKPTHPNYRPQFDAGKEHPNVVISMNGTAGLTFAEWSELKEAIDAGIKEAVETFLTGEL